MRIEPIAYDSFSTRSMSTFIETKDINIFIDPSIAISPKRYGLEPHPLELDALETGKKRIIQKIKESDILIITHYHWDHCPRPNSEIIKSIIGKKIILKDIDKKINKSQKERGKKVIKVLKDNNEISIGDKICLEVSNTLIEIPGSFPHGSENPKLGYVNIVFIEEKEKLLFGSDIQGFFNEDLKKTIIKYDPTIFIFSGPPTYLGFFNEKNLEKFKENLKEIINKTNIKKIIIDHHLLRDLKWNEKIKDLIEFCKEINVNILTAAEYSKRPILQLEARRKELYEKYKEIF